MLLTIPILAPIVLLSPEIISTILGRPGAEGNLSSSDADVMGVGSLLIMILMLSVTPVITISQNRLRWITPLRRRYGIAFAANATVDLTIAAIVTFDTFPGGFLTRVAGHTFLLAGTAAVIMTWPLAFTANDRSLRWLGRWWKKLHWVTYVIAGVVLLHLYLLFAFRSIAISATAVYIALIVPRVPRVRKWLAKSHTPWRWLLVSVLAAIMIYGLEGLVHEFVTKGYDAWLQAPPSD